jgi:CheY-like chemotaxis protein
VPAITDSVDLTMFDALLTIVDVQARSGVNHTRLSESLASLGINLEATGADRGRMILLLRECEPVVVVVEDDRSLSDAIREICDHLDVTVLPVLSKADLAPVLARRRPMAVVTEIEAKGQDGYHVMKTVARHDRNLPILLLTGGDPALLGAADAVQEAWGLSLVVKRPALPTLGELAEFLCLAAQEGNCLGVTAA